MKHTKEQKNTQEVITKTWNNETFNYVELNEKQMKVVGGGTITPADTAALARAAASAYTWLSNKYDEWMDS